MDEALRNSGAETVEVLDLSLEEIFVETVKGERANRETAASAEAGDA